MFKFLTEYWNRRIADGIAKRGSIDVQVDVDWKMQIVEAHGIVIDPALIKPASGVESRRMLTTTIFTITEPHHAG